AEATNDLKKDKEEEEEAPMNADILRLISNDIYANLAILSAAQQSNMQNSPSGVSCIDPIYSSPSKPVVYDSTSQSSSGSQSASYDIVPSPLSIDHSASSQTGEMSTSTLSINGFSNSTSIS